MFKWDAKRGWSKCGVDRRIPGGRSDTLRRATGQETNGRGIAISGVMPGHGNLKKNSVYCYEDGI
jgi:hypothetical protein